VKRRTPLWLLGGIVWAGASVPIAGLAFYASWRKHGAEARVDWLFVGLLAGAIAGAVVMAVHELRSRPSPAQQAALSAIFNATNPGTIGAVVVMKDGTPEVIATVRSREEYLELAGSGRLPADHLVFLPDDA
jgi:hypothetical protein